MKSSLQKGFILWLFVFAALVLCVSQVQTASAETCNERRDRLSEEARLVRERNAPRIAQLEQEVPAAELAAERAIEIERQRREAWEAAELLHRQRADELIAAHASGDAERINSAKSRYDFSKNDLEQKVSMYTSARTERSAAWESLTSLRLERSRLMFEVAVAQSQATFTCEGDFPPAGKTGPPSDL